MRIRTQLIVTMLLFGVVLAAIFASAIITGQGVEKASQQEDIASSIAQGASQLNYLANDYFIYQEAPQSKGGRPVLSPSRITSPDCNQIIQSSRPSSATSNKIPSG